MYYKFITEHNGEKYKHIYLYIIYMRYIFAVVGFNAVNEYKELT